MRVRDRDERLAQVREVCAEHTCGRLAVLHLDLEARTLILHVDGGYRSPGV